MPLLVGYTTGVFDLFHIGHLRLLQAASQHCDQLIVGVATDEMTLARKGILPVVPFEDRCEIVSSIKGVCRVVAHGKTDDLGDWEVIHYQRIFKGSDWQGSPRFNQLSDEFAKRGIEVIFFPYTMRISTTLLRARLASTSQPPYDLVVGGA